MSPSAVLNQASVIPGPPELVRATGMRSRRESQAAIRSAVGLSCSAAISPAVMSGCAWSSVAASSERHGVARVQPKLVGRGERGDHLTRVIAGGGVGHPSLGEAAERVLGGYLGGGIWPPGHHRHVGHQQRRHHRVGVLPERTVHAQHNRLAR
jgi:hypothetical protein